MFQAISISFAAIFLLISFTLIGSNPVNSGSKCLNEKYRPQFHFSPIGNWINDPNGMVYYDGEYHLFYQYNPFDTVWGPMHWGHAISTDLSHWTEQPIALFPDELGTIFSGGGVVDSRNTSGFQTNPEVETILAIYTSAGETQQQSIAYSNDKGRSFEKFDGNPIIPNPGIQDFRDPKVGHYYGKWIQSLAVGNKISFYESGNMKEWTFLSDFGQNLPPHFHGGVWECPDLLEMTFEGRTVWVLIVSINPGGPNGGSATKYFVGDFNGREYFHENGDEILWLDWGADNYAGVTFSNDPQGRYIFIGWMNNWAYGNELPTIGWRGQMTLPRELKLINHEGKPRLAQTPSKELEILRNPTQIETIVNSIEIPAGYYLPINNIQSFVNPLMEVDLYLDIAHAELQDTIISICFWNDSQTHFGNKICVEFYKLENQIKINRGDSGDVDFSPNFSPTIEAQRLSRNESYIDFKIFIDLSSIEVFADDGTTVLTALYFPENYYFDSVGIFHESYYEHSSITLTGSTVYGLNSIHNC